MSVGELRHNAFVYESDEEYVRRSVRFLKAGLDAGEAAVVASTRDRLALIREGLGSASQRVTFTDAGSLYVRPARTIAAYYETLLKQLRSAPSVRVIAEVQFGPTPGEWDEWTAYEAIFNRAFAHLSAWVVCMYDARALPDRIVETAWRTHSQVLTDDWHTSPQFEDPEALLRTLTPEPELLPELRSLQPGDDLQTFRERLARELSAANVPQAKALEMLVAASEIAANAWQHAGGPVELRVGSARGRFVCEISDLGSGLDDPLAGYIPPKQGQSSGAGIWIARQLTWRLELLPGEQGLTVRLWL